MNIYVANSFDGCPRNTYLRAMATREIIKIPDAKLREVSKAVERIDGELLKLLDDMAETMYEQNGLGLAGIQVGEPVRVFVMDCDERERRKEEPGEVNRNRANQSRERNPVFLINPEIIRLSEARSTHEEGCLSIPDYFADVERPTGCIIKYTDRNGEGQMMEADGLTSTCIQHEMDHLDGHLFIDYLSKLKRDRVIKKFTKAAKQNGTLPEKRMLG